MISYTLIITYILLGAPNELIIPDFESKEECQAQIIKSSSALKCQGAKVESTICHKVILNLGS
jgi:hypothetical protein